MRLPFYFFLGTLSVTAQVVITGDCSALGCPDQAVLTLTGSGFGATGTNTVRLELTGNPLSPLPCPIISDDPTTVKCRIAAPLGSRGTWSVIVSVSGAPLPLALSLNLVPASPQYEWSPVSPSGSASPDPRRDVGVCGDGTSILVFGGWNGSSFFNDFARFNGSWTLRPGGAISPRAKMGFMCNQTGALVVGGNSSTNLLSDAWFFSFITELPTALPSFLFGPVHSPGVAYDPVAKAWYLLGGRGSAWQASMWRFTDATGWIDLTGLGIVAPTMWRNVLNPFFSYSIFPSYGGGVLIAIGGNDGQTEKTGAFAVAYGSVIIPVSFSSWKPPNRINYAGMYNFTESGSPLVIFGGEDNGVYHFDDVWQATIDPAPLVQWFGPYRPLSQGPGKRYGTVARVLGDSYYVFGGADEQGRHYNDLWRLEVQTLTPTASLTLPPTPSSSVTPTATKAPYSATPTTTSSPSNTGYQFPLTTPTVTKRNNVRATTTPALPGGPIASTRRGRETKTSLIIGVIAAAVALLLICGLSGYRIYRYGLAGLCSARSAAMQAVEQKSKFNSLREKEDELTRREQALREISIPQERDQQAAGPVESLTPISVDVSMETPTSGVKYPSSSAADSSS